MSERLIETMWTREPDFESRTWTFRLRPPHRWYVFCRTNANLLGVVVSKSGTSLSEEAGEHGGEF